MASSASRGQTHRTHGEVVSVRAEADRAALKPLPAKPYLAADRHYVRTARSAWSASRLASTRCPGGGCAPGSRSSCASARTYSSFTPCPPAPASSRCSRPSPCGGAPHHWHKCGRCDGRLPIVCYPRRTTNSRGQLQPASMISLISIQHGRRHTLYFGRRKVPTKRV